MCNINKPHDKFFKETFGDIDVAKDFIKNYVPPDVLGIVDLNNLEAEKDSFIDENMRVLILYIMSARKDINVNEIYKAVQSISTDRSEMIMTIAEQLISEGEMKGKKEGEYKKAVEVAIEMIKDKQPIDRITKYS